MTKEQVKSCILEQIEKNPKSAKEFIQEYKEQKLARLNTELRRNETLFNRKGYKYYRSEALSSKIIENRKEIKEVEDKTAEELFIDDLVSEYYRGLESSLVRRSKELIKYIKSRTDEDNYIRGVFLGTKYHYIGNQRQLECEMSSKNKIKVGKIKKIYESGLSNRDQFIKNGEEYYQVVLAEEEETLKHFEDIDKRGPEILQNLISAEVSWKKYYCRELAEMSVVDAFDQMDAYPMPKQKEKIQRIVRIHDPAVVESAMQNLIENPTENMNALAKFKDRSVLKSLGGAGAGALLGLASTVFLPTLPLDIWVAIGASTLVLSGMGGLIGSLISDNKSQKEKSKLVSACLDDLLNEVVSQQKNFDKGMEK